MGSAKLKNPDLGQNNGEHYLAATQFFCVIGLSRVPSVDDLERQLNLPRCAGRFGYLPKTGPSQDVCRQAHVDDVEQIEEFTAELQVHALRAGRSSAKGSVFYHREVVVVVGRPAEGVASKRAEPSLV